MPTIWCRRLRLGRSDGASPDLPGSASPHRHPRPGGHVPSSRARSTTCQGCSPVPEASGGQATVQAVGTLRSRPGAAIHRRVTNQEELQGWAITSNSTRRSPPTTPACPSSSGSDPGARSACGPGSCSAATCRPHRRSCWTSAGPPGSTPCPWPPRATRCIWSTRWRGTSSRRSAPRPSSRTVRWPAPPSVTPGSWTGPTPASTPPCCSAPCTT